MRHLPCGKLMSRVGQFYVITVGYFWIIIIMITAILLEEIEA